jgi:hypothetical protein
LRPPIASLALGDECAVALQETAHYLAVDALDRSRHIVPAAPEAFLRTGGTMRTARKTRQDKHTSVGKPSGSSRIATAQVTETLEISAPSAAQSNIAAPRGMARVPTHAVTVPNERRQYPRARLRLPLKVVRIAGRRESEPQVLYTANISSSGLYARCPYELDPGTPVDLEVELVRRMAGRGMVRMLTQAHVVRLEGDAKNGWHSVAFTFDDITFQRDDILPPRFTHS